MPDLGIHYHTHHVMDKHYFDSPNKCEHCQKLFKSRDQYRQHLFIYHTLHVNKMVDQYKNQTNHPKLSIAHNFKTEHPQIDILSKKWKIKEDV